MKNLNEVLENYNDYQTPLEDRFGARLCEFLDIQQIEELGFSLYEQYKSEWKPKEWTYNNILLRLRDDAEFGLEKAENGRGISSNLMYEVCKSWCKIIERRDLIKEYDNYGIDTFKNILEFVLKELENEN